MQFLILGVVFIALEFLADDAVGVLAGAGADRALARAAPGRAPWAGRGDRRIGLFIGLGVRLAAER